MLSPQLLITLSATSPAAAGVTQTGMLDGTQLGRLAITSVDQSQELCGKKSMLVIATLQGATGGTLDVFLEGSINGGTTWFEYIHWVQLAAGAAAKPFRTVHSRGEGDNTIADLSATLVAASARKGEWGKAFRLKMITGAGMTVGAIQKVEIFLSR